MWVRPLVHKVRTNSRIWAIFYLFRGPRPGFGPFLTFSGGPRPEFGPFLVHLGGPMPGFGPFLVHLGARRPGFGPFSALFGLIGESEAWIWAI